MTDTVSAALRAATVRLRIAGIDGAARDAKLILAHILNCPPDRVTLDPDRTLTASATDAFALALSDRAQHRPVSQILGCRAFWGRDFIVTGDVLDPRPETETLIEAALNGPRPKRILDLGTGTGCIALTLLAEWPDATALAVDLSDGALDVARQNADRLDLLDRVEFRNSDWFSNVSGRFDLIVSNPPYISTDEMQELSPDVREWEPHLALTPGGDGLEPYRIIATQVAEFCNPCARLLMEMGHQQAADVKAIFNAGLKADLKVIEDLGGHNRILDVALLT